MITHYFLLPRLVEGLRLFLNHDSLLWQIKRVKVLVFYRDTLKQENVSLASRYIMCRLDKESAYNLILLCPLVISLWQLSFCWIVLVAWKRKLNIIRLQICGSLAGWLYGGILGRSRMGKSCMGAPYHRKRLSYIVWGLVESKLMNLNCFSLILQITVMHGSHDWGLLFLPFFFWYGILVSFSGPRGMTLLVLSFFFLLICGRVSNRLFSCTV